MSGKNAVQMLAGLLAVTLVLFLALVAFRAQVPQATAPTPTVGPTPTATATATLAGSPAVTPTATPTATQVAAATQTARLPRPCETSSYQAGDPPPIAVTRLSGQYLQIALDYVRPGRDGNNRWGVRFFVPEAAPGPAVVPLSASITGPSGPLAIGRYQAGPPNAGSLDVTQPVTVQPCSTSAAPGSTGTVVITVESGPVRSGTYTLTWRDIRLPEGGTRTESWTVTLTCEVDPGPAQPPATSCR